MADAWRGMGGRLGRCALALLAWGALAGAAVAAEGPTPWPEAEAVVLYLATSPEVAAARQAAEVARAAVTGAAVWANPTLVTDREQVFTPGGPTEQNRLGIQVDLPVTGARALRLDVAEAQLKAAEARAREASHGLVLTFRAAFADAAAADARVAVLAGLDATHRRLVRIVEVRGRSGESAGADVARMRLAAADVAARLAGARSEAEAARGRLAGSLARPVPGTPRPAEVPVPPAVDALLAHALRARPGVLTLEAERRAAQLAGDLARRRQWPEPQLGAGVAQVNEPTVQGLGYTAGVSWPIPVFDRAQGDHAQARAALASADARLAAVRARLLAEVPISRRVLLGRLATRDQFVREALPRLPGLMTAAEAAYKEGASPLEVLLGAAEASAGARLRAIDLDVAARAAQHDLERLVGASLTAIGRTTP